MGRTVTFYVPGRPIPQGSMTGNPRMNKATGKISQSLHYSNASDLLPYRRKLSEEAKRCGLPISNEGPVWIRVQFIFARPKNHFQLNGMLRTGAPIWMGKMPDVDKLARGVLDSFTGILYQDDAQVVDIRMSKVYEIPGGLPEGVHVEVSHEQAQEQDEVRYSAMEGDTSIRPAPGQLQMLDAGMPDTGRSSE